MFKVLDKPTERMSRVEMHKLFKDEGFIILNPSTEFSKDGIAIPSIGSIYAICDKCGYKEMVEESLSLHRQGIDNMIDAINIEDNNRL